METVTKTIEEINNGAECPLPISVIPNEMGINLVSVNSISWTKQEDGQLVSLTINFLPKNKITMKKQTAVEWYENKLIELDIDFGGHKNYWIERNKIRDQAKQMEKEQIEIAWYDGISGGQCGTSEEYYKETYGGQDEQ